jgi:hypothetical protein
MPTKKYALEVGGPKRLVVSWGIGWKRFSVKFDGQEVVHLTDAYDTISKGSTFPLPDGSALQARLQSGRFGPKLLLDRGGKPVPGSDGVPVPRWAYAFFALSALIPIVALGGALPALLGSAGALVCAGVARDESKTTTVRITICAVVTLFAWAAFALLMLAAARVRGGA